MRQPIGAHGLEHVWWVVPTTTPAVQRHCRGCGVARPFQSTERFRINAQGRRVDVWLVYRCAVCAVRWKREVFVRCLPEEIGAERYARLLRNEVGLAREYALGGADAGRLAAEAVRVERPSADEAARRIRFRVPYACALRLEVLLANELGVARARLRGWAEAGVLRVEPGGARALRRPVRDGQLVVLPCVCGRGQAT